MTTVVLSTTVEETAVLGFSDGNNVATADGVFVGKKCITVKVDGIVYEAYVQQSNVLNDSRHLIGLGESGWAIPFLTGWEVRCSPGLIMKVTALLSREGYL